MRKTKKKNKVIEFSFIDKKYVTNFFSLLVFHGVFFKGVVFFEK